VTTGLTWLNGKCWWQVSRDERYFCAELYHLLREDTRRFVAHLNAAHGAQLDAKVRWEVAYEACFYRDLWHERGRAGALLSAKRTFDLALFSDQDILLIEAKAQQRFDAAQLQSFAQDAAAVQRLTEVPRVRLAALTSSLYTTSPAARAQFGGPHLSWKELGELYDDNAKLLRADALFEPAGAWAGANNSHGHLSGSELLAAFERGERFLVGRRGGLNGAVLAEDMASGDWRTQPYETNRDAQQPPNRNWFTLEEFARCCAERS
jgi:hypothetical protein